MSRRFLRFWNSGTWDVFFCPKGTYDLLPGWARRAKRDYDERVFYRMVFKY